MADETPIPRAQPHNLSQVEPLWRTKPHEVDFDGLNAAADRPRDPNRPTRRLRLPHAKTEECSDGHA